MVDPGAHIDPDHVVYRCLKCGYATWTYEKFEGHFPDYHGLEDDDEIEDAIERDLYVYDERDDDGY